MLKQRNEGLPKLIAVRKEHMHYEKETLQKIIEARNRIQSAMQTGDTNAIGVALYCQRIRIEVLFDTLFDTLKNRLGAFRFHFWTKYLPKHSRQPKSNKLLKTPSPEHIDKVMACWRAMETYVFCASVVAGNSTGVGG